MENKIIVALDGMTRESALSLAKELKGGVWGYKVNDLLLDCGVQIIRELKEFGNVFADAKLYDIPNTVGNSVTKLSAAGADLITIHASGGRKMISQAVSAAGSAKILAVSILTSFSQEEVDEIYAAEIEERVLAFARMTAEEGAPGMVCSPKELTMLSAHKELDVLLKVIPGVRPAWQVAGDDQTRVTTPAQAVQDGAGLLVIGRPITQHQSPKEAVDLIREELGE